MNRLWTYLISICLIIAIACSLLYYQAYSHTKEKAALVADFAEKEQHYKDELVRINEALTIQNKAIELYQADLNKIEQSIIDETLKLEQEGAISDLEIERELKQDASNDNQMRIIGNMLHDFSK